MVARQRVHDLGVFKAIGMTPRQLVAMMTCWVLAPGLAAAAIAVPAGIVLEHAIATAIVNAQTSQLSQIAPPAGAQQVPRSAPGSVHARVYLRAGRDGSRPGGPAST